jgi:hypothetical protein
MELKNLATNSGGLKWATNSHFEQLPLIVAVREILLEACY